MPTCCLRAPPPLLQHVHIPQGKRVPDEQSTLACEMVKELDDMCAGPAGGGVCLGGGF